MKFGPVPPHEALGAIMVHSVRTPERLVKKGTIIGEADIAALETAGVAEVVVARLEADDIGENESAAALARAIAADNIRIEDAFTGRANLYSEHAGVLMIDRAAVDRFNRIDEAVTLATLPEYRPVQEGEMVATVKIITFAIPRAVHEAALAAAKCVVSVAPGKLAQPDAAQQALSAMAAGAAQDYDRIPQREVWK